MDGFKKSYHRRSHIYVHDKKHQDETLVKLYKESEFAKENATSESADNSLDINEDEEIEDFINDSKVDEEAVPVKKSVKKARKKAAKKQKAVKRILLTILKLIVAIALIGGLAFGTLYLFRLKTNTKSLGEAKSEEAVADEIYYSPLTGMETNFKDVASAEVTCIMIENSTSARPQSGLRAAGIVYEAIAEGGISRFMAVYQENKPEYIGPVRSARLTFVHFAKQYQCGYMHMGGASNAINELRLAGYRDINAGFYEEKYVSRKISRGRYAPHNVYTRFSWIDKLNFEKGWTSSTFTPFARIQPDTINEVTTRDAQIINIKLSGDSSYNPSFNYDVNSNTYLRSHQRGGAHMDRAEDGTLTQISPNVVIAMKVHVIPRANDVNGYSDHVTYGEGDAFVFQDGTVTAAKWRRDSPDQPLKFYNSDNIEILLNRGQTWITAYPDTIGSVTWQ